MRHWIRRSLWVCAFGCLWLPVLEPPPLHTAPYLQNATADGITVAMITATPARLRCEVHNGAGEVVAAVESDRDRRRHALRIEGLQAASEYRYQLSAGGEPVGGGRFRTAPTADDAPVRFAFLGDSGAQPWWVWLQTAPILHLPARWRWLPPRGRVADIGSSIADYGPDFMLHLGDIVYPKGRHEHYSAGFFRPFGEAIAQAPFYFALGNHDVMDTGGLQTLANFHPPTNDITGDGRIHSFVYGPVRVICLDCTDMFAANGRFEPGHPSHTYVERELRAATEPWIIVASHYPMRSASRQRDRADLLKDLRPLLERHAVSLYLAGHDHCYQRFASEPGEPGQVPLVVSGGGGKSLYEVLPTKGAVKLVSAYHWCSAEIRGAELRVRAHGLDGAVLDDFTIDLASDLDLEGLRRISPARAARVEALL